MRRTIAMTGLWLVLVAPTTGVAGEIRGVLRIPAAEPAAPSANPYPGTVRSLPRAQHPPRGQVTDAVIYVEALPPGAVRSAASGPAPRLGQKDQSFVPRVLPVAVGTAVDFPNFDPIYHNVFSLSPARRFDLGKYPRGQSRRVTFGRTGIVNVYCDIHADMEAFVVVLPHHAFTQPDAGGAYRLGALPPGRYVVRVWHPDRPAVRREVTIPESGTVTLDLEA